MDSGSKFKNYDRSKICVIEPAKGKHTHTLIFLHGLGDSGASYVSLFDRGGILHSPNMKVLLPTAPQMAVTCNNGAQMNSWFDIKVIL